MKLKPFLFYVFCTTFRFVESAQRLNEYIKHFESLDYDTEDVHQNHLRAKRSLTDPFLRLNFHAHGRHFNMRLKRDTSTLADDIRIEGPDGKVHDVDLSHLYDGVLWGESGTKVYGSIRNGTFEGKIHTPKNVYYVEKASRYFKDTPRLFHSVIYSSQDVEDPYAKSRENFPGGCGATRDTLQWMQTISNSAVPVEKPMDELERRKRYDGYYMYTEDAQRHVLYHDTDSNSVKKRACTLFIQTDTFLWDHFKKETASETQMRDEITSLIWQHVKSVNNIYEHTLFSGKKGIKFIVQRIKINDTTACIGERRSQNPFCSPNIDVSNFLNFNSQMNHDDFCLAYIFTYRDFAGGTLGLAWVASPSGASGGICEKYKSYTENSGGRQIQTKRSLNTGVITFVNYNSRVPPKVSELTLAHEIGHNFGSPHDFPLDCRPGGHEGNFIMYASATSGDRHNNNKFSRCSRENISAVLQAIQRGDGKYDCFVEDKGPFCGNKIVEDGEECDCGYDESECTETCCYAKGSKEDGANPCHLRPGKQCSPSQGPCCSDQCTYTRSTALCKLESECSDNSYCSGKEPTCPTPTPKENKTECNKGTQVCWSGECVGSICQKYNLEECFLKDGPNVKPEEMCMIACQEKTVPGQPESKCLTTASIPEMSKISGIKLQPGSPCNDFRGYCDVFQKCRSVDAEGPLARLKNLLFNKTTLRTIRQWVTTYWWGVLLMLLGLMIFMGVFIKCCAVHTPSSNPNKSPALRITDTLRRPADTLRRKRHHHHQQQQQQQQVGPPPPYSASRVAAASPPVAGPSHGYGEGRGHYNKREQELMPAGWNKNRGDENPYAPAYRGRGEAMEMKNKKNRA